MLALPPDMNGVEKPDSFPNRHKDQPSISPPPPHFFSGRRMKLIAPPGRPPPAPLDDQFDDDVIGSEQPEPDRNPPTTWRK